MNIDESKTVIGNKKYNLKFSGFEVPQSMKNQNNAFKKQSYLGKHLEEKEQDRNETSLPQPPKIASPNIFDINKVVQTINNKKMESEKNHFLRILSDHEENNMSGKYSRKSGSLNHSTSDSCKNFVLSSAGLPFTNEDENYNPSENSFINRKRKSDDEISNFNYSTNNSKAAKNPISDGTPACTYPNNNFNSENKNLNIYKANEQVKMYGNYLHSNINKVVSPSNNYGMVNFPLSMSMSQNINPNMNMMPFNPYFHHFNNKFITPLINSNTKPPQHEELKEHSGDEEGEIKGASQIDAMYPVSPIYANYPYNNLPNNNHFNYASINSIYPNINFNNLQVNKGLASSLNIRQQLNGYMPQNNNNNTTTNSYNPYNTNISNLNSKPQHSPSDEISVIKEEDSFSSVVALVPKYKEKDTELGEIMSSITSNIMMKEAVNIKNAPLKINKQETMNKLKDLLSSKKLTIFFKLFYKGKELKVDLNVLNKTIDKCVMKVEYFLSNSEFMSLKIISEFKLCAQIEVHKIENEEDTNIFFNGLKSDKVALVDELEDFYAVFHIQNKEITTSLNIDSMIADKENLLLIIKINDDMIIDKIRNIIKDMFENKSRTVLYDTNLSIYPNSADQSEDKTNSIINISNYSKSNFNDEVTVKADYVKELTSELEDLRQFKYIHKQNLEEAIKNKESEIKNKFKIYYEKLLETEMDRTRRVEKEKENLLKNNEKLSSEVNQIITQTKNIEKEISRKNKIIENYSKDKSDYEKNVKESLKILKEKQDLILYYKKLAEGNQIKADIIEKKSLEIENKLKHQLVESKELVELAKLAKLENQKKSPKVESLKIDDFIIQEYEEEEIVSNKLIAANKIADEFLCIVCGENVRNCLFNECHHLIMCLDCTQNALQANAKGKKIRLDKNNNNNNNNIKPMTFKGQLNCPVCKITNTSFKKLFLS